MSTGAITFPLKLSEALTLYSKNESFGRMSLRKQHELLMPFKMMDKAEEELKNLDIVNTSDQMSNSLKIVRRNASIQKDFFSMMEYTVYAVNQYMELDYYKRRRKKGNQRVIAFYS